MSFSACFSELAPLEALQQRFGRCNRRGELAVPALVTVFCKLPSGDPRPYEEDHLNTVLIALRDHCGGEEYTPLTEKAMAALLDKSYPEAMKLHLGRSIRTSFEDIRKHVVDEFTPYGPRDAVQRDELERQWQALFDGEEVLPDVLLDRARGESTWLGRARYMVPVPSHWLRPLKAEWNSELMCFVAAADYSSDTGLKLRESAP